MISDQKEQDTVATVVTAGDGKTNETETGNVLRVKLINDEMTIDALCANAPSCTDESWQSYMVKLSQILSESRISPEFRNMAATKLRNALTAKEGGVLQVKYDYRWLSFNKTVRQRIKNNVFKSLDVAFANPSPAALCIVSIAAAELPNGQWPDLINNLVRNIVDGKSSDVVKEASFQTFTYLYQELGKDGKQILLSNANAILKAILLGLKDANIPVMIAALNALEQTADLYELNFDSEMEKRDLIQLLSDIAEMEDVNARIALVQCLTGLVTHYYNQLNEFLETCLFDIIIDALKSNHEELRLKAIDFFKELCYVEDELREKAKAKGNGNYENRFYTLRSLAYLLPIFMGLLTRLATLKDDTDTLNKKTNESWDKYLGFLKELVTCCSHLNVDQCIMNFIKDNITKYDWRYRNAALAAFNTILRDSRRDFEPLVVPLIQIMLEDENVGVRATAARAVVNMCADILQKEKYQEILMPALLKGLTDEIEVAATVCNAISYLAYAGKWKQPKYFVSVVHLLLNIINRLDADNRLQWEAAYALHFIVGNSQTKCYFAAYQTALKINEALERDLEDDKSEEYLSILHITFETFLKRLPIKVSHQVCNSVMTTVTDIIKKNKMKLLTDKNLLSLFSTIIKASGSRFTEHVHTFRPYVVTYFECQKCPNNNSNRAMKKEILLAILFTILAVGYEYKTFLDRTINSLIDMQTNLDKTTTNLQQQIDMHKYLLKNYRGIVHVFKRDRSLLPDIVRSLKPSISTIVKTISKIANKEPAELETFLPTCIEEIHDVCYIIDKTLLYLIEDEAVTRILNLAAQSESNELKAMTKLINKKIALIKSTPGRVRSDMLTKTKSLFERGIDFLHVLCPSKLFGSVKIVNEKDKT